MSHRPKDMGQHYFVEELDSPKGTTGPVADLSWKPPSPSHRDVGLSHIFDRLLCLKHKHPGDHESEVSSKKQNLAIVWGGSSSNTEAGGASVSLPLNQSSIAFERKACRRGSKTIAIKDSKRCGRKKVGTSLSGTDLELVEVSVSQSPDYSDERVQCDVSVEEILFDDDLQNLHVVETKSHDSKLQNVLDTCIFNLYQYSSRTQQYIKWRLQQIAASSNQFKSRLDRADFSHFETAATPMKQQLHNNYTPWLELEAKQQLNKWPW
ncbi:hypothetical protein RHMOL_Rhmol09G0132400 [Rhododendron molle]|uniref:Uncharacterized protein n=1 Tax=Rhododendron molle TaxID=49168 RepID=A0ACC0MCQ7_RHOML|nr:hypothetical protein RHMOL_Rhmol09G0132400 [Rhododendron molle]